VFPTLRPGSIAFELKAHHSPPVGWRTRHQNIFTVEP
jgi:hypothetical protein